MKYFTIKELTQSETAQKCNISNTPNKEQEQNLIALVHNILDPLREAYKKPIVVTSGFRSLELNTKIKGSPSSQHMKGQAADIRSKEDSREENKKIFNLIQELKLPFDQLIDEYNYDWVHVSFSPRNRRQILHIK